MMKAAEVPLGARIPSALKKKLDRFCREHGLKMSHVVAEEEYDAYIKRRLGNR
jgi:hypothetical protein